MFQCSAACGAGIQTRSVVCAERNDSVLRVVDDVMCVAEMRLSETQECTGHDCAGVWFTGPWGKVSVGAR